MTCLVVSLAATPSGAAPPAGSPEAAAQAKQHFDTAKKAYKSGAYREAIGELNQAIELDPNGKDLFYNLGLVHEKLGEIDEAIRAFKRYSELETNVDDLEKAIQTVRRLEGARDELKKKEEVAPAPVEASPTREAPPRREEPKSPDKPKKGRLDAWVYGTGGVALVALGAGVYFGVSALSERQSTEDATGSRLSVYQLEDRAKQAHDHAVLADVSFAVAGVAAGAAALLYFTRDAKPSSPRVTGSFTQSRATFAFAGAF